MPKFSRSFKLWTASSAFLAVATVGCVLYLDLPVASLVKSTILVHPRLAGTARRMPDFLLHLVLLVTVSAWCLRAVRVRKGIQDRVNTFLLLLCVNGPAAFLMKAVLKPLFGRLNNRLWLKNPDLYGFYWFDTRRGYDAFPSGHMLVLVALAAVLWRFYPATRVLLLVVTFLTAVAVIVTGYHFVSDILAGAYCGIVVEALVYQVLVGNKGPGGALREDPR